MATKTTRVEKEEFKRDLKAALRLNPLFGRGDPVKSLARKEARDRAIRKAFTKEILMARLAKSIADRQRTSHAVQRAAKPAVDAMLAASPPAKAVKRRKHNRKAVKPG